MRKIVFGISLLVATTAFAQKEELKTLKKLYSKEKLTQEEFAKINETIQKLEAIAASDEDKIAAGYYKSLAPFAKMAASVDKPNILMLEKFLTPQSFSELVDGLKTTLDFETKTGKIVFTNEINEKIASMKPFIKQKAFALNDEKKYKEASDVFYNIYKIEPNDVSNLENAAITAMQGADYIGAEKYYREIKAVGFKGTGVGKFGSKESEVAKNIAALAFFNKNDEQAKKDFVEAIKFNPDDIQLQMDNAALYYRNNDVVTYQKLIEGILQKDPNNAQLQYNVGFLLLKDDEKIVEEINANLKNLKKYDELNNKRKEMFMKALPYFERAYQLDINNVDIKNALRLCYQELKMKDKAAMIK